MFAMHGSMNVNFRNMCSYTDLQENRSDPDHRYSTKSSVFDDAFYLIK